jgi:hypothetical protein
LLVYKVSFNRCKVGLDSHHINQDIRSCVSYPKILARSPRYHEDQACTKTQKNHKENQVKAVGLRSSEMSDVDMKRAPVKKGAGLKNSRLY